MSVSWNSLVPQDIVNKALKCVIASGKPFCPDYNNIFKAFTFFAPKDCIMVWVEQDPYPQKGVANGILFSNKLKTLPEQLSPSLKIIKNSLLEDLQISEKDFNFDPTLESWVKQGILMINSALTVEMNKIGSHTMIWRPFTKTLLKNLSEYNHNILFVLFGSQAQTFRPYISKESTVLEVPHPAYSARTGEEFPHIFKSINSILSKNNKQINWI